MRRPFSEKNSVYKIATKNLTLRKIMKLFGLCSSFFIFFIVSLFAPFSLHAENALDLSKGQTVYVPVYSHIYVGNREKPFLLAATLSIRNIDLKHPISIIVVDYYETQGNFLKHHLEKPVTLNPLESIRYVIPERDKSGGSGANIIVEWKSDKLVNPPIVESIMIGAQSSQGISFTSRGRAINISGE